MKAKDTLKIYHQGDGELISKIKGLLNDNQFNTIDFNILEDFLTPTRLLQLSNKLKLALKDLVDTESDHYKSNFSTSNFDDADWVRILIKNPELIKTPIVETSTEALLITSERDVTKLEKINQNVEAYDKNHLHNKTNN